MSSLPNLSLINLAKDSMLTGSKTSSWWNTTFVKPMLCSIQVASVPLFSSLAVSTTVTPLEAICLTVSRPMPLFAPVTTAYLRQKAKNTPVINQWNELLAKNWSLNNFEKEDDVLLLHSWMVAIGRHCCDLRMISWDDLFSWGEVNLLR